MTSNVFHGLNAVVTGGSSGIGAAVVGLLEAAGAHVVALDRSPFVGSRNVHGIVADIVDDAQVDQAIHEAADALGGIDILVNNAGIGAVGDIMGNPLDEWKRVFDVNVFGLVRTSRAALPFLRNSEHGSIVNTCSAVAIVGVPQRAIYSATKGAVASLTLAMAADHVGDRIRVNAVLPGTTDTPWVGRLLDASSDADAAARALQKRQPLGRLVTPEEVGSAILYLASPTSGSTTGTLLNVDGGMTSLRLPNQG